MTDNMLELIMKNEPVELSYVTDVKLTGGKKNPLQGQVTKETTHVQGLLTGVDTYANKVKSNLVLEGKSESDFVLKERPWGKRVGDSPIIEHKDQKYLEFIVDKEGDVVYKVNGVVTDPDTIEGMPKQRKDNKESQGGASNKVSLRCIKLENITDFKVYKEFGETDFNVLYQIK